MRSLRFEPAASQSQVKHSTTEPLHSLNIDSRNKALQTDCQSQIQILNQGSGLYSKHVPIVPALVELWSGQVNS